MLLFSLVVCISFALLCFLLFCLEWKEFKFFYTLLNFPPSPITELLEDQIGYEASHHQLKIKEKIGNPTNRNYVIVGTGSVGLAILDLLLLRGETNIKTFDIKPLPKEYTNIKVIKHSIGNVNDLEKLEEVIQGAETVFLTVAIIHYWASFEFEWQPRFLSFFFLSKISKHLEQLFFQF